jgi:hypothetical protein
MAENHPIKEVVICGQKPAEKYIKINFFFQQVFAHNLRLL